MTPNERPTPLTDALRNKLEGAMSAETNDALDLAGSLECSLAERTDEINNLRAQLAAFSSGYVDSEQHNAMAKKLAKCREALVFYAGRFPDDDLGDWQLRICMDEGDLARKTLEETK